MALTIDSKSDGSTKETSGGNVIYPLNLSSEGITPDDGDAWISNCDVTTIFLLS